MVRVGFPGGPRLEWYDRNPIMQQANYGPSLFGPHSETVRATYTVPTGKKAFLASMDLGAERHAASTTDGVWQIFIVAGAAEVVRAFSEDSTVYARVHKSLSQAGIILAGQDISLRTSDVSTGGTVLYAGGWNIVEFDA